MYQPAMERVRSGEREWVRLDDLHRESLVRAHRVDSASGDSTRPTSTDFNRAWHRLESLAGMPWRALTALRRRFVIGTCSNGNVAMMVNMAKRAGLPWDAILGAEPCRAYKPLPAGLSRHLRVPGSSEPERVVMVAAHNDDLVHAASHAECAPPSLPAPPSTDRIRSRDFEAEHDFDFVADDFVDLAAKLGAA